ncbi:MULTISPECIES: ABC transporter permease [Mesonia]|uniref:ABC transporter permease YtrF n=1 Tax=Mesonia oceanica TaxID=2687242 RepID=A0AC61YBH8_9FLAO|nr:MULTISPECIES: FtsX-like permease family protein [Mesonia]MAN27961.1 transmembrane permease [Mesonia sp.]MAQ41140.1 transmembrane permease [Mesonia sp.]VVV01238.1 ABC transporter permease YtrF [Mesonia oceanica]
MNFEYFISKRLISAKDYKSSISAPIIKIAVSAIAVGVIMMLIAVATGVGLKQKIRDKIAAFNGHIIINNLNNNNSQETQKPISTHQDFYPEFNSVEGIDHIQGVATKYGIIRTETDFEGIIVKGVGTDYRWDYLKEYLVEGKLPVYKKDGYSTEILISEYLSKRLGFKVGDKVIVYFMNEENRDRPRLVAFQVSGIFNSGFQEFDETYLIADINQLRRLNKWNEDEVGNFEVFIDDFDEVDVKGGEVYENIGSFLDAKTIRQAFPSIFEWVSLFDFNIALIIGIMIIVSGINMITALLVLILERTQMIGMLKAMGSTDWSIRKIFLYNAAYLIIKGLLYGNIIGIGILLAQKYFKLIPLNPETYYVTEAPIYFNWDYILLVNIGTLLLCMVMLLIPSYIITRITPSKSIRFE